MRRDLLIYCKTLTLEWEPIYLAISGSITENKKAYKNMLLHSSSLLFLYVFNIYRVFISGINIVNNTLRMINKTLYWWLESFLLHLFSSFHSKSSFPLLYYILLYCFVNPFWTLILNNTILQIELSFNGYISWEISSQTLHVTHIIPHVRILSASSHTCDNEIVSYRNIGTMKDWNGEC